MNAVWDGMERRKDRKRMRPENLRPINGQIVVVDDLQANKVGNIYLPDAKEPAHIQEGTVLAASRPKNQDGTFRDPEVSKGSRVLYTQFAGANNTFIHDSRTYRIVKPEELLAVIL